MRKYKFNLWGQLSSSPYMTPTLFICISELLWNADYSPIIRVTEDSFSSVKSWKCCRRRVGPWTIIFCLKGNIFNTQSGAFFNCSLLIVNFYFLLKQWLFAGGSFSGGQVKQPSQKTHEYLVFQCDTIICVTGSLATSIFKGGWAEPWTSSQLMALMFHKVTLSEFNFMFSLNCYTALLMWVLPLCTFFYAFLLLRLHFRPVEDKKRAGGRQKMAECL